MEYKYCHDYVIDSMTMRERLAIIGKSDRTRHFAMPCSIKQNKKKDFDPNAEPVVKWIVRADKSLPPDPEPQRRKPRFDDNIF
eukprot:15585125-Heterocapsa_arctica.AAC.1